MANSFGYAADVGEEAIIGAGGAKKPWRLLLVEDEPDLLWTLAEILERHGYVVVSAPQGEDAVDIAALYEPNVIVSDFNLPGIDGVTTIHRVRQECPKARSILMSGHISGSTRRRAEDEQVDCILEKPVPVPDLLELVGVGSGWDDDEE